MIRPSDVPVWVWTVAVLLLLLALSACAPRTAPPAFALPVPPLPSPPPTVEAADTGDACPDVASMLPGQPPPYVAGGVATCRAMVVPEADVLGWLAAEDDRDLWADVARIQHDARIADRLVCEEVAAQRWADAEALRREGRALRWAGWGLGAAGLAVGIGVGITAGVAAGAVTP